MKARCRTTHLILLFVAVSTLLPVQDAEAVRPAPSVTKKVTLTGGDLSAWRGNTGDWQVVGRAFMNPDNNKLLSSEPGTGIILNGPTGRTTNLLSKITHGDVKAHIEFMIPEGSNSGVYFMGRYEIQVFDSYGKKGEYPGIECGGIYERWDESRKVKGFEGHSPRVNASREPGQWQTFDVIFRAPRFDKDGRKIAHARFEKVVHNGAVIHADVVLTGPTRAGAYNDEKPLGPLMLQGDHGPVAYRNIQLEPAGPNPFFAMDTCTKDAKHQTPREQIEMLGELGYDGIGSGGYDELAAMVAESDRNDLRFFAVYLGVNIDAGQQPYDPRMAEAIKTLEGRNSILWLYVQSKEHKPSSKGGDPRAVEIIREIAANAAKSRVRIALYPHHRFWIETVEDAIRVAKQVNRDNVGVTFNLCHWLMVDEEENMEALIESAMPYLFLVTINGADSGGKDWKSLIQTLDKGTFDMARFLKALGEAGYTGPIGLQGYGIGGDAHDNLERSMRAWRRLSKQLMTTGN